MDSYSALQQQYPLSPRKWWKKMITTLLPLYIFAAILGGIDLILFYFIPDIIAKRGIKGELKN